MQLDFAGSSQDGRLHIRIELVNGRNPGIALRLAQSGNFQFASGNELRRKFGAQARQTLLLEQSLQLVRRPGKQHDDSFPALIFAAHPLSGGAAVGVGQDGCTGDDVGLLEIVRRHFPAARGEALFETGNNRRVAVKSQSKRVGYRFASEIVFGRAKSAHEDDDLGARHGKTGRSGEMFTVVANDGLENHLNPKLVELFGQIKRVRILTERSQQLGANGDDLGIHE